MCLQREIAPGAEARVYVPAGVAFPESHTGWCGWSAPKGEENTIIGNYYCQRFRDAWAAARIRSANNSGSLEKRMRNFCRRDARNHAAGGSEGCGHGEPLHARRHQPASALPMAGSAALKASMTKARLLLSATARTCGITRAPPHYLFPSLARSHARERVRIWRTDWTACCRFACSLPDGKQTGGTTAADGTMGQIMKAYLDWRLSGDDEWLRRIWPRCETRDRVRLGRRAVGTPTATASWKVCSTIPTTSSSTVRIRMCGIYYLGALRACEEMARAMGEAGLRRSTGGCSKAAASGSTRTCSTASITFRKSAAFRRTGSPSRCVPRAAPRIRSIPDFQVGRRLPGGSTGGPVRGGGRRPRHPGGPGAHPQDARVDLQVQLQAHLSEHDSVQRIYALNDEAGAGDLRLRQRQRVRRFLFRTLPKCGPGSNTAVASLDDHARHGARGREVHRRTSRRRYDGERRNPWDEAECGHHYARAMAAWSAMVALSGFRYSGPEKRIVVAPAAGSHLVSFYSTASSWGRFTHERTAAATRFAIAPKYGRLAISEVELRRAGARSATVAVNKTSVPYQLRQNGDRVVIVISEPLSLTPRDELSVVV